MTTMTIHVEDFFAEALRDFAEKGGRSINQTVKAILAPVLGLQKASDKDADPYGDLLGALSHDDAEEMRRCVAAQRTIDEGMWK